MTSKKFSIDWEGLAKVGKGSLIAGSGVALTYLVENLGSIDFGQYTAVVVGVASILVNFFRKYLTEQE